jgi:hypothetical protein
MANKIFNVKLLFSAFITLSLAYGVYEALFYDFLAKIFPLYVSIFLLVLAIFNLILEIRSNFKGGEKRTVAGASDLEAKWDIPMTEVWKRLFFYIGIICLVYVGIWVIGYPLSITLCIILFYRYVARTKWIWSFVAGLAGFGFLVLAFQVLNMDWPQGLITLPWPLG